MKYLITLCRTLKRGCRKLNLQDTDAEVQSAHNA